MTVHDWASKAFPCLTQDVGLTYEQQERINTCLELIITQPTWVKDLANACVLFDIWLETKVLPVTQDPVMQILLDGFVDACTPRSNGFGCMCYTTTAHRVQIFRTIMVSCKKWAVSDGDDSNGHHLTTYGNVGSDSVRNYLCRQRDLGDSIKTIPHELAVVEAEARRLLAQALSSYANEEFAPRMGPGSVFQGLNPLEKWWCLDKFVPERLSACFGIESFTSGLSGVSDQIGLTTQDGLDVGSVAKLTAVPKDMWKMRVITIPELHYAWAQQGVRAKLMACMRRSSLTRHLDLLDQSKQAQLAMAGSYCGELATFDFTDASDYVTWAQVQRIWPEDVLRDLRAIRADQLQYVDDAGVEQRVENFSFDGMGNAATFVVETLTFWAYCQAVSNLHCLTTEEVYVYGDDIIVHYTLVPYMQPLFLLAGWKLNVSKSFFHTGGEFRESCGVHAWKGIDVTPLRFGGYDNSELSACKLASQLPRVNEVSPTLASLILKSFDIFNFEGSPLGSNCVNLADQPRRLPSYRYYRPTQQWEVLVMQVVSDAVGSDLCSWGTVLSSLLGYSLSVSTGVTNPRPRDRRANWRKPRETVSTAPWRGMTAPGRTLLHASLPRREHIRWSWLTTTPARLPETSGRIVSAAKFQDLVLCWQAQYSDLKGSAVRGAYPYSVRGLLIDYVKHHS